MQTEFNAPVILPGKLVVKTINGRNGSFNVGLLETAIGSFSVKNRELEQYAAGIYQGQFIIGKIFLYSYSYGASSGFELRARIDGMDITTHDNLTPGDEQKLIPQVNDPLDEETLEQDTPEPVPTKPQPEKSATASKRKQFVIPSEQEMESTDLSLFGELWPLGDIVKLDATAPRQQLRQQRNRLDQLGYQFVPQAQHFIKTPLAS